MVAIMSRAAVLAAVSVCLCSVAAIAQERIPVEAVIKTSDLDLGKAADLSTLRARVRAAAASTCVYIQHNAKLDADAARCRNEMEQSGETMIASLIRKNAVRVASNTGTEMPAALSR
jgi:UrcA family protein